MCFTEIVFLAEIEGNIMLEKRMSGGAPYYVLGPLPAGSGAGYDHIGSATMALNRQDVTLT